MFCISFSYILDCVYTFSYSDHEAISVVIEATSLPYRKIYRPDFAAQLDLITQALEILKKACLRLFWKQCWMVAISLTFLYVLIRVIVQTTIKVCAKHCFDFF